LNPAIITPLAAAAGLPVALWTILGNFNKSNQDHFRALDRRLDEVNKRIDETKDTLQKQIESAKETLRAEFKGEVGTLRAEMREMRAELRSDIREIGERRVIRG
jgi:hypothetical protein